MKITFYKNNTINGEYNVSVTKLTKEFWNTRWAKTDMMLWGAFLVFLSERSKGKDTWDLTKDQLELVKDELIKTRNDER